MWRNMAFGLGELPYYLARYSEEAGNGPRFFHPQSSLSLTVDGGI